MSELPEKYMIGLSGGINSMAVLCWLIEQSDRPKEIYLFYAHFAEHSPDTFQFVADGIRHARSITQDLVEEVSGYFYEKKYDGFRAYRPDNFCQKQVTQMRKDFKAIGGIIIFTTQNTTIVYVPHAVAIFCKAYMDKLSISWQHA